MRMWSWVAAAFIVLVLQTTSLGCFGGNLFFDLPLLFIYSVGLFYGARTGLFCGLVFGLLQDISSPAVFGFYLLTRGLVGYGIGSIKEMIFKNNYGYHVLILGCLSLLPNVWYMECHIMAIVEVPKSPYLCRRKQVPSASTGIASAIRASSIALGSHCPCIRKQ